MSLQARSGPHALARRVLHPCLEHSRRVIGDGIFKAQAHPQAQAPPPSPPNFRPAAALRNDWSANPVRAPAP